MTYTDFTELQEFKIGEVMKSQYGHHLKLVARPLVDLIGEFRWIGQLVEIKDNKAVPSGGDTVLYLYSTKELRDFYCKFWTPDPVVAIYKGDAFKDDQGNYYVAEDSRRAWKLSSGTWATLVVKGSEVLWGGVKVTPVKTVADSPFSKYLG